MKIFTKNKKEYKFRIYRTFRKTTPLHLIACLLPPHKFHIVTPNYPVIKE